MAPSPSFLIWPMPASPLQLVWLPLAPLSPPSYFLSIFPFVPATLAFFQLSQLNVVFRIRAFAHVAPFILGDCFDHQLPLLLLTSSSLLAPLSHHFLRKAFPDPRLIPTLMSSHTDLSFTVMVYSWLSDRSFFNFSRYLFSLLSQLSVASGHHIGALL